MPPRGKQANGLLTQRKMLRAAITLFLEKGYEKTTTAEISHAAGMTASSFFRAFPSKEGLLLELVQRMFGGQFVLAEQHSTGDDPVLTYAVETALQLHIAELTEPLRELYVMAYTLPSTSDFLYHNTARRLQAIFTPYCPGAQAKDFYETEIASAGMMRAFMAVPCNEYFTIEAKIARFLDCALKLYNIPDAKRTAAIGAVLQTELRPMAEGIIRKTVEQAEAEFEALIPNDVPSKAAE